LRSNLVGMFIVWSTTTFFCPDWVKSYNNSIGILHTGILHRM
jgi:hypothetical protein